MSRTRLIGVGLVCINYIYFIFSREHATLHLAVSVGPSVINIFELRAVFALRPLPNRPRPSCRVSGLVIGIIDN